VPVGAGVTLGHDRFLIDARFTYRQTFDDKLVAKPNGQNAGLESWATTLSVGYRF